MIRTVLPCRPSLRLRLWLGALGLSVLTLSGAGLAVFGLTATERRAQEALAAQTRLEAWSSLSTRISEWMLSRMLQGGASTAGAGAIETALARLEALTAADVAAAPDEAEASRRAADIRHVARMKSFFSQMRALAPETPAGQAGIAFHLTHAPAVITSRIEHETRRRDLALKGLEALRRPLRFGMAAFAVAAPLLLLLLWRGTLRPLFDGLRRVAREAPNLSGAEGFAALDRHDELGLMFARMRQASRRIARRRARLERDLADLESLVEARTTELTAANSRLSAIDAARRRFFADVSHELRTPLTVIMGEAELGAMTADPDLRQSFHTITSRAERLFRRIEDLLRIARSESGELELSLRDVPLPEALEAARGDVAPLLSRASVTVSAEVPAGLRVRADPDWLRQIFAGIFENSVKFAGKDAQIRITAQISEGRVRVQICDSGKGPQPPAEAPLFDRHIRSASPGVSGFGIGLALARWAAREFGGDLRRLALPEGFGLELELTAATEGKDGPYSAD
ncbi:sensor histidine kinase [Falsigemmobacter intermedius]|uniref:histidine kinase n=1 Tax=Falsigemmobacter intermedius TaxID=1553448 RepID=A0A444MBU7_9RHOB|nr:HAMP domain-containing sensor histidine kinase [Falsigemmobacter intermedius]RWY41463.1 HAMP domain-containing histidine kinase [Falsigemmobacter intermedius]